MSFYTTTPFQLLIKLITEEQFRNPSGVSLTRLLDIAFRSREYGMMVYSYAIKDGKLVSDGLNEDIKDMERNGWLEVENGNVRATEEGKKVAYFFQYTTKIEEALSRAIYDEDRGIPIRLRVD